MPAHRERRLPPSFAHLPPLHMHTHITPGSGYQEERTSSMLASSPDSKPRDGPERGTAVPASAVAGFPGARKPPASPVSVPPSTTAGGLDSESTDAAPPSASGCGRPSPTLAAAVTEDEEEQEEEQEEEEGDGGDGDDAAAAEDISTMAGGLPVSAALSPGRPSASMAGRAPIGVVADDDAASGSVAPVDRSASGATDAAVAAAATTTASATGMTTGKSTGATNSVSTLHKAPPPGAGGASSATPATPPPWPASVPATLTPSRGSRSDETPEKSAPDRPSTRRR
ncbi:hypothetical protein H696_01613 [Fonticula alba]|uniref:Uncharacterized protein n=1 Tax=Fonticula alba TaxID=691883 RepID=A0A058ZE63_FONAL|nr:hypothetical protein H696_01613 [Fonticula alba]KCV72213.1 hypothetical protein H696_01613 [Fonticula alba]|eukprot:XP_009493791.1 hypothetical protein H696_01613 [Fonticula alba]